ncbi:MAG: HDIG domain-containing protein [Anaerolineae bacterium]
MSTFPRDQAWTIVTEYIQGDGLRKHMLAVEAAMRAYAPRYDGNPDEWGVVGLLHDFDWEVHPTFPDHPTEGAKILRARGVPEDMIVAILSHADFTGVPRLSPMEKALFAVDELTGLIMATALVRPTKSIHDVDVRAVRKRWKDKAFARGVNREDIEQGAAALGVPLEEHIGIVLTAMQDIAPTLGVEGVRP